MVQALAVSSEVHTHHAGRHEVDEYRCERIHLRVQAKAHTLRVASAAIAQGFT
jgi:hypothetical protein